MVNSVSHIVKSRSKRRKRRSRSGFRMGYLLVTLFSLAVTTLMVIGVWAYSHLTADLPSPLLMEQLLDPETGDLLQPTRILDRSRTEVLWSFGNALKGDRDYVYLDFQGEQLQADIPQEIVKATLAASDPQFFSRRYWGLSQWREPHPQALPNRLVHDLLLWDEEDSPRLEFRINLLTSQLIAEYGHEQILEWYLNQAFYGNHIYGVEAAAQDYLGKSVRETNLAEAAVLAAVGETPSLNPWDSPAAARENQQDVLRVMVEEGLITEEEREVAEDTPVTFTTPGRWANRPQPEFVEVILDQAERHVPRERLIRGGMEIISTLDRNLQEEMACTINFELSRVYGRGGTRDESCRAARLLPAYPGGELESDQPLGVEGVVLDPGTGQVLAMIGYPGELKGGGLTARHAPGTLLTPFIYLSSFTQGQSPASLVWDIPREEFSFSARELHPGCQEDCEYRGPVNIRRALVNDYLSPAMAIWREQGSARVEDMISRVGVSLEAEICRDCDYFPGSHQLGLLDVVHSFSVFSNLGELYGSRAPGQFREIEPSTILEVRDVSGSIWMEAPDPASQKVLSPQLAYLMNHVLSDESARAYQTQRNLFEIGRPAAVKTGFVEGGTSTWTVGYTPAIVAGIWSGTPAQTGGELNLDLSRFSAGLWRALTQYVSQGESVTGWEVPEGVRFVDVCVPSGMLPGPHCPETAREVFLTGNEPVQQDTLFQAYEINRETGRLATVFTPPEMIESRVYLSIPEEAREWASSQGLAMPPQSYDPGSRNSQEGKVRITWPENYSYVRGEVKVRGRVAVDDLVSFRLQVGKGLNPESWQQVGEELDRPQGLNLIGAWDTGSLSDGLYALQLVVLSEGQRVEKSSVLVSVDNTPPVLNLPAAMSGAEFSYNPGEDILFQVQAEDNTQVDRVEFYLNSRLGSIRESAPYLYSWPMGVGSFNLQVRVYDLAGNQTVKNLEFSVSR